MSRKARPTVELLDQGALEFFERYLSNQAPSGEESHGQEIWAGRIGPYVDEVQWDPYGTAIGVLNPGNERRVVLAAHADEIGWMVSYIMPDGYLRVEGTADPATALCREVSIRTKKRGRVDGVMGWPATHLRDTKKEPSAEDLFVDCGCTSRDEVEKLGIRVGDTVMYSSSMLMLNENLIVGRALDNRIGGLMLTEVARLLKAQRVRLPFTLYFVNAVQEEVGTKGAKMVVETLKPHVALVTDVTHDTSMPGVDKAKHGDLACGKGPVLSYGPAVHNSLSELLERVAEEQGLPYQRQAAMKSTGTDTDAFAYGSGGTRSALISIPVKYMHTPVESCGRQCVVDAIRLMVGALRAIGRGGPALFRTGLQHRPGG